MKYNGERGFAKYKCTTDDKIMKIDVCKMFRKVKNDEYIIKFKFIAKGKRTKVVTVVRNIIFPKYILYA